MHTTDVNVKKRTVRTKDRVEGGRSEVALGVQAGSKGLSDHPGNCLRQYRKMGDF